MDQFNQNNQEQYQSQQQYQYQQQPSQQQYQPQYPQQPQYNSFGEELAPVVKVSDWIVTAILLAIPIVNIVMLFVWAFGDGTNKSKSNYCKAALILMAIGIGIAILFSILTAVACSSALSSFSHYY